MRYIICLLPFLAACATSPKCGNPAGSNIVYSDPKTCEVRIRQVLVGTKMQIPESLKGPALVSYEMTWVDTMLVDGKIQIGHFVMIPKSNVVSHE